MANLASRPPYARNDTDQVNDEQPKKKSASVVTTELPYTEGGEGASSSTSDTKKKLPYEDGSGRDSEHGVNNERFENLILDDSEIHYTKPVEDAMDLVTEVLHADDDTSLNPWTFRMWFLGAGLSIFGGVLSTIYYFKPQTVFVSVIFLAVISYVLGEALAYVIPRQGWIGRWFNPHPFNHKEHAAIIIMSSAAANAALGIEVLAVQRLWYAENPNAGTSIFLLFSSQCIGYGIAGLMRTTLVYPTRMLYPVNIPVNTLLETLHRDKKQTGRRLKVFYYSFAALFIWELFPEYIMPILTGFSVFCLAKRDSLVFTNLFGGSDGNEGLGFLSFGMDWNYISAFQSPLWFPLQTLVNNLVGYFLGIFVFLGVYYNNVWSAKKFPFLSQLLFSELSNGSSYVTFNQTAILDSSNRVDPVLLAEQGLPFYAATYATSILTTNMALTATFVHMLLWCYGDISPGWAFINRKNLQMLMKPSTWKWKLWQTDDEEYKRAKLADPNTDPHYKLMLNYKDSPNSWYGLVLVASFVIGLICLYRTGSTMPWWALVVAIAISYVSMVFFSAMYAITGFSFNISNLAQLIGAYMNPGLPVANMYFTLYGYNSINQGQLLLKDLKIAQYAKLPPRCTFTVQMVGTLVGAIFNYVMMDQITKNQRDILLSIEGTNVWSGQQVQSYNSNAIAWGGLAKDLFSAGARFQWVAWAFPIGFFVPLPTYFLHRMYPKAGFDYWNLAIIVWYIGWLCVGINSNILPWFLIGFYSQFYLRKYKADWFIKYNYILSAGMDGGTQVMVFIMSFAFFGASGKQVVFPDYWGNNFQSTGTNFDYCMRNPAN